MNRFPDPARFRPAAVLFACAAGLAALAVPASARVYEAEKGESLLSYHIVHPFKDVRGVNRDFECTVDLSEDTAASKVTVSARVEDFDSGNSSRDSHAMEAIHARKHPKVTFVSDAVRKGPQGWIVHGDLTFAGRTRPVEFVVVSRKEAGKVRVGGGFAIKLSDYGVKPPSLMFVSAEDKLDIRFDLVAKDE